ncbi:hypothetical protein BH23ACT12_BH23ACT12_07300 [soil metagenome]
MRNHLLPESLSAYLDGELDERERAQVDQHLSSCSDCSGTLSKLAAAMGSVASLGPVTMTADEHRSLRQSVLKSRPSASGFRLRIPQWALAGGLVVVAVTALALSFLRSGSPVRQEALTEAADPPAAGGEVFDFSSGEEVDRTVAGLPEVAAGLNRYRAGDAGTSREGDGDSANASDSHAGSTTGDSAESPPQQRSAPALVRPDQATEGGNAANDGADAATGRFTSAAGAACLAQVAGTQSYPMVPLLACEASFEGRSAWLLVYAWSPGASGRERLDQWQSWLVDPTDCRVFSGAELAGRALYRSFSTAP